MCTRALFVFLSIVGAARAGNLEQSHQIREVFQAKVSSATVEASYADWVGRDACTRLESVASATNPITIEYIVYVDRNPDRQRVLVALVDALHRRLYPIGWDRVSTGRPQRPGHFVTPTGVFINSLENVGYRALGTKNARGWRGLGTKGSRIWDFGWQWTDCVYRNQLEQREIRLLLHATDPDFGESRLGRTDSKGCVRTSARLNWFLDHYGILDREYEQVQPRFRWLLSPAREPVQYAGRYLIVGDSRNFDGVLLVAQNP